MKEYFKDIDLKDFWDNHEYYLKTCTEAALTDETIADAQARLGYRLPESYIALMKTRNGGKPVKYFWIGEDLGGNNEYEIAIGVFFGIGKEKEHSLFGRFGNEFWFKEWEYPRDIGVIIADTISGGHEMIYLDYRECGKDGEPRVSICFQESDYLVRVLANNFEAFVRCLISEDERNELSEE